MSLRFGTAMIAAANKFFLYLSGITTIFVYLRLHYQLPKVLVCEFFSGFRSVVVICEKNNDLQLCFFRISHCQQIRKFPTRAISVLIAASALAPASGRG
ncbi:MAG: hypothetical protein ACRYGK_06555 [Janthinobacterium lividum]